jgi:Mn2+/Fe2+ NRAMP family transporter
MNQATCSAAGRPYAGRALGLSALPAIDPSLLLALVVGFVLVMQLLDANETTLDRLTQGLGVLVYLAAFAVEVPAFGSHWPSSNRPALR